MLIVVLKKLITLTLKDAEGWLNTGYYWDMTNDYRSDHPNSPGFTLVHWARRQFVSPTWRWGTGDEPVVIGVPILGLPAELAAPYWCLAWRRWGDSITRSISSAFWWFCVAKLGTSCPMKSQPFVDLWIYHLPYLLLGLSAATWFRWLSPKMDWWPGDLEWLIGGHESCTQKTPDFSTP